MRNTLNAIAALIAFTHAILISQLLTASPASAQQGGQMFDLFLSAIQRAMEADARKRLNARNRAQRFDDRENLQSQPPIQIPTVRNYELGTRYRLHDLQTSLSVRCTESQSYNNLTWCSGTVRETNSRGSFTRSTSLLVDEQNTLRYINQSYFPAYFSLDEIDDDIRQLERGGMRPARLISINGGQAGVTGKIALWGNLELAPLEGQDYELIGHGAQNQFGILLDQLLDYQRSYKNSLPIYRLSRGQGYAWIGHRDANGRGALRFFSIDADFLNGRLLTTSWSKGTYRSENNSPEELEQAARVAAERLIAEKAAEDARLTRLEFEKAARDQELAMAAQIKTKFMEFRANQLKIDDPLATLLNKSTKEIEGLSVEAFWARQSPGSKQYNLYDVGKSLTQPIAEVKSIDFAKIDLDSVYIRENSGRVFLEANGQTVTSCNGCTRVGLQQLWLAHFARTPELMDIE